MENTKNHTKKMNKVKVSISIIDFGKNSLTIFGEPRSEDSVIKTLNS